MVPALSFEDLYIYIYIATIAIYTTLTINLFMYTKGRCAD